MKKSTKISRKIETLQELDRPYRKDKIHEWIDKQVNKLRKEFNKAINEESETNK